MENWYAAKTLVGREIPTVARLSRYETFLPIIPDTYWLFGNRKERLSPLFPGYFFLRCEPELRPTRRDDFWGLLGAEGPGIGEPLPIDDEIILGLRGRERNGVIQLPELEIGQQVEVVEDGPLFGRTGLYHGMAGSERVIILIQWFGRDCPTQVSRAALRAVTPS
jgi:transcription antitermination factor NusG